MTSSNVIEYKVIDKNGKEVGSHRQNVMCSRCNDGLLKFKPFEDFRIQAWGYDEDEEEWEDKNVYNLGEWLKKNPAEFTFKSFVEGDKVKVKRKGIAIVNQVIKDRTKFFNSYEVKLEEGEILIVSQNDLLQI